MPQGLSLSRCINNPTQYLYKLLGQLLDTYIYTVWSYIKVESGQYQIVLKYCKCVCRMIANLLLIPNITRKIICIDVINGYQ